MSLTWTTVLQFAAALAFLACGWRTGRRQKFVMAASLLSSLLFFAAGLIGLPPSGSMNLRERQEVLDRNQLAINRIRTELNNGKVAPERLVEIRRELQTLRETLKTLE